MNDAEALQLLDQEMEALKSRGYRELARLVGEVLAYEKPAASGTEYQLEIQPVWGQQPGGPIRIIGSVDDGGWRAYVPLTRSVLIAPE